MELNISSLKQEYAAAVYAKKNNRELEIAVQKEKDNTQINDLANLIVEDLISELNANASKGLNYASWYFNKDWEELLISNPKLLRKVYLKVRKPFVSKGLRVKCFEYYIQVSFSTKKIMSETGYFKYRGDM